MAEPYQPWGRKPSVKYPDSSAHVAPGDVVPCWETLGSLTGSKKSSVHPSPLSLVTLAFPTSIWRYFLWSFSKPYLPSDPRRGCFVFYTIKNPTLKFHTISPPTQLVERILSSPFSLIQGQTAVSGLYYKGDQGRASRFLKDPRAPIKQSCFFSSETASFFELER